MRQSVCGCSIKSIWYYEYILRQKKWREVDCFFRRKESSPIRKARKKVVGTIIQIYGIISFQILANTIVKNVERYMVHVLEFYTCTHIAQNTAKTSLLEFMTFFAQIQSWLIIIHRKWCIKCVYRTAHKHNSFLAMDKFSEYRYWTRWFFLFFGADHNRVCYFYNLRFFF